MNGSGVIDSPYSIVVRNPELLAFFGMMIVIEIVWRTAYRKQSYGSGEALASIGIALGRAVAKAGMGVLLAGLYLGFYELRVFTFDMSKWWSWAVLFLAADFVYYWMHRFKHEIRWMWADHAVHHSGNHMNFFINYRLGWTGLIAGTWLMYLPLVLVGFAPAAVVGAFALSLVWQFWIHTEMIGKLGPLELVLNTPSHHRVHHGRNAIYIDRNYAGILIIWDRMFGTFQEELEEEPCDYGLVKRQLSVNPFVIAFSEWASLIRDVRGARSWPEGLRLAFGYPGDKDEVKNQSRARRTKDAAAAGDAAAAPGHRILAENSTAP